MNNNDVLRKIRYTFNYSDSKMMEIFELANHTITRSQLSNWLKKDDDPENEKLYDKYLALFLNGLIIEKRGKKEGEQPIAEKSLNKMIALDKEDLPESLKMEIISNYHKFYLVILDVFNDGLELGKESLEGFKIMVDTSSQIVTGSICWLENNQNK